MRNLPLSGFSKMSSQCQSQASLPQTYTPTMFLRRVAAPALAKRAVFRSAIVTRSFATTVTRCASLLSPGSRTGSLANTSGQQTMHAQRRATQRRERVMPS